MAALLDQLVSRSGVWNADSRFVERVGAYADSLDPLPDDELLRRSQALMKDMSAAKPRRDQPVEVAAAGLMAESVRRVHGFRLHDVQLLAARSVACGQMVEMQTGEGKTLVVGVAAYLQSLRGRGVHVATTNTYLARRDYETIAPVLALLGQATGLLEEQASRRSTQLAYACDVTYGTGFQFGFDYLRDQLLLRQDAERPLGYEVVQAIQSRTPTQQLRQRNFGTLIVDEADSVMIDEALVPLVLSGGGMDRESTDMYRLAEDVASRFVPVADYVWDPHTQVVSLTESGATKAQRYWQEHPLEGLLRPWRRYVENALLARLRFHRDRDYVVRAEAIHVVDQNTGRIFDDRSWRDGLHQAIEVKEGLTVRESQRPGNRITRQRYFQQYDVLAGLSGTITESAAELRHFYQLPVRVIPPHRQCRRRQMASRFFSTQAAKWDAIATCTTSRFQIGQPVLIGTSTIAESHEISQRLTDRQVPHDVLNGIQDAREADLVSRAGRAKSVLVATNMAGRGTDIKITAEAEALGGLHVVAAQHALSARVDRQLLGRAARQGDSGSFQFFASAEDELVARYSPMLARRMVKRVDAQGECHRDFSKEIGRLQRQIEHVHFVLRRRGVEGDAWMDDVRATLH